uniref:MshA n=1 Tax=Vibrio parahaemolyticus TaxID=670 RepID=A0A5P4S7Y3_VIBPH|nr:mshA [Vibrio parahaemolyticus]
MFSMVFYSNALFKGEGMAMIVELLFCFFSPQFFETAVGLRDSFRKR